MKKYLYFVCIFAISTLILVSCGQNKVSLYSVGFENDGNNITTTVEVTEDDDDKIIPWNELTKSQKKGIVKEVIKSFQGVGLPEPGYDPTKPVTMKGIDKDTGDRIFIWEGNPAKATYEKLEFYDTTSESGVSPGE